jgi:hypothetical protein
LKFAYVFRIDRHQTQSSATERVIHSDVKLSRLYVIAAAVER